MFAQQKQDQTKEPAGVKLRRDDGALRRKSVSGYNPLWQSFALRTAGIHPKLSVSQHDDPDEREADFVADQVMARPAHSAVSDSLPRIQRFAGDLTGPLEAAPASVDQTLATPGRPLEPPLRQNMEQRFGYDFSSVRVHSGETAEQSAHDVNAHAYTLGHNIVFAAGQFKPETHEGQRLIAHELTHVAQQTGASSQTVAPSHNNTLMRDPNEQAAPAEPQQEETPEWVLSILGDRQISLTNKLRAVAMGIGFIEFEPKSEDEFVKDLASSQADNPAAEEPGLSSEEAGKQLTETIIRNRAVDKAMSLMGADWHAPVGSAAYKTARGLHGGDPQDVRSKALTGGMVWAFDNQDKVEKIKEEAIRRYNKTKSAKDREVAEAADGVLMAVSTSLNASLSEQQHSPADAQFAESAWRYLGSEKSKKYLEKVGFPLAWFTTCVTLINPTAEAAGVDTKKWGPLDMFDKRRQERFKEAQASQAWVPAEKKEQPKRGDILISVSYPKEKGVVQKEMSKATFQHVAILVEPVTTNADGTEKWVTADGGKGSSHAGQDKTGLTDRRYNPNMQQFITDKQTNLQEAAEGGRYLLGFWSITRLPMRPDPPIKAPAKKGAY